MKLHALHSVLLFATVADPDKYLLLCEEVHLIVKKYACSVEEAMSRHIKKDRRVLTRFRGIYHLSTLNKVHYEAVSH